MARQNRGPHPARNVAAHGAGPASARPEVRGEKARAAADLAAVEGVLKTEAAGDRGGPSRPTPARWVKR